MNGIKLSIIVPIYNLEPYLQRCVQSILNQTHCNLEILLINDGSTDRSGQIADQLAESDSRIRVIHKSNGGSTSARLAGIQAATGSWIGFVDGDDWIEPDMYDRLLRNALEYDVDISHCGYQMVFPDGHIDHYHNSRQTLFDDRISGLCHLLDGSLVEPSLWNKLYRRTLFQALPSIDLSIHNNEDLLMNYYLFSKCDRSVFEDFCPYHYQLRPGSATTSGLTLSRLEDPLKVTRILIQETSSIPELHAVIQSRLVHQLISGATMSVKENRDLILPFRAKCRQELNAVLFQDLSISCKLKLQAIWAARSPSTYAFIHTAYTYLRGTHNLYDID